MKNGENFKNFYKPDSRIHSVICIPIKKDAYTWWSYRFNARKNNAGWRIDYFLVSDFAKENIKDSIIHNEIMGSDHCPIELNIDL